MENTVNEGSKLTALNYTLEDLDRIDDFRESILDFEKQLVSFEGSYGDPATPGQSEDANKINPLNHTFAGGCYVREISMPKGQLISTGIHKKEHPFFVLKGDVSVLTDTGLVRITAPYSGVTQPGTKRLIYIHEDTIWTTVHATDKETVEDVIPDIIAKDFSDPEVSLVKAREMLKIKTDKSCPL
jgi:hypothetical protein